MGKAPPATQGGRGRGHKQGVVQRPEERRAGFSTKGTGRMGVPVTHSTGLPEAPVKGTVLHLEKETDSERGTNKCYKYTCSKGLPWRKSSNGARREG